MKILVTGSKGFIGKNLISELTNRGYTEIYSYDKNSDSSSLENYCKNADFIFHLAGVNRPKNESEFMEGNFDLTSNILKLLKKHNNKCPIMLPSSIQAELSNPYGKSKKAGEELLFNYGLETGSKVLVYRFPNVFGKWSQPNYNSVIATFSYNVSRNIPIVINDPEVMLNLVYIDDVVDELIRALNGKENIQGNFCEVSEVHSIKLDKIVKLIKMFKETRTKLFVPDMSDPFTKKLYSTYLSFLDERDFSYELKMNKDERGSFTEFLRTEDRGQVSINVSKPGIIKGNHWHHTKNEKFLVVSGQGKIRFRKLETKEIIEYNVSGDKLEVVDIPVGYTHNIENTGTTDMVTVMWANEPFDADKPDTYFLEV